MKRAMENLEAMAAAEAFIRLTYGAWARFEIAGSLRRGREFCNDVEILMEPAMGVEEQGEGLFPVPVWVDLLERRIEELVASGELRRQDPIPLATGGERQAAWGPFWKQLVYRERVPVDLFVCADAEKWGRQLVTRTGPAKFSKALVTERPWGFKPMGIVARDGGLYTNGGELIPCPTEEAYFEALGVPWIEAKDRDRWEVILGRRAA